MFDLLLALFSAAASAGSSSTDTSTPGPLPRFGLVIGARR